LLAARAALVALPGQTQGGAAAGGGARRCLLVELVGDRFLRRMVRRPPLAAWFNLPTKIYTPT
jgi:hypothetical protein